VIKFVSNFQNDVTGILLKVALNTITLTGTADQPPPYDSEANSGFHRLIGLVQSNIAQFYKDRARAIWIILGIVIFGLYCWYLVEAMLYEFGTEPAYRLLIGTILVLIFVVSLMY
jgi:hypothetical protein